MKKKLLRLLVALSIMACMTFVLIGCTGADLDAPTGLKVDDAITLLSWESVSGARSYQVDISGSNGYSENVTVKRVTYGISYLETNVTYTFRVKAVGDGIKTGSSSWSEEFVVFRPFENGMKFELINDSTEYQVIGIGTAANSTSVVEIPSTYRGKTVTKIAKGAFTNNVKISKITIPDTIVEIGDRAFRSCTSLTEIIIPNSVTTIGTNVFQGCTSLTKAVISDNLVELNESAFHGCSKLNDVTFGKSLEVIGKNAFFNCRELGVVRTTNSANPDDVTSSYYEVVLPSTVKTIGEAAFAQCVSVQKFNMGANVITIEKEAFYSCTALEEITFSKTLQTVSDNAFTNCTLLTQIAFPDTLTTLGDEVFAQCLLLFSVDLGDGLEQMGKGVFVDTVFWEAAGENDLIYVDGWLVDTKFASCKVSDGVYQDVGAKVLTIEDGTVGIASSAVMLVPITVTTAEDEQYQCGNALEKLYIPDSVKTIGEYAFSSCINLSEVYIGSKNGNSELKLIDKAAFSACTDLLNLQMYCNKLEKIGDQAFYKCERLGGYPNTTNKNIKEIDLPSSLREIGSYAFKDTYFWTFYSSGAVYVGGWVVGFNGGAQIVIDPVKNNIPVVGLCNYAFYDASADSSSGSDSQVALVEISLPGPGTYQVDATTTIEHPGIKYIGRCAFYKCDELTSITIPNGVTEIKEYTFAHCTSLYTINLGKVKTIGRYAFYNCGSAEALAGEDSDAEDPHGEITGLENAVTIGEYAFYNNKFVKSITLSENLVSVGKRAFFGMGLIELTVPGTLEQIDSYAFASNVNLVSLTIGEGIDTIGTNVFYNSTALTTVNLPSTLAEIGDYAFKDCTSLASIEFNDGLQVIGKSAFAGCSSLTDVVLPSSVETVDNMAFRNCTSLTGIILNDTLTYMGSYVFHGAKITFYTSMSEVPASWNERWNAANRPVLYNCDLSADGSYVESFEKTESTLVYFKNNVPTVDENGDEVEAKDPFVAPLRDGYVFLGWSTTQNGAVQYDASEIYAVEDGTMLFAIWELI